jgi:hypothetical protein
VIQGVEAERAREGLLTWFCMEHSIQAECPHILSQVAIADGIPESGVEDQAIGIDGSFGLVCLAGAIAHPDTLFLSIPL